MISDRKEVSANLKVSAQAHLKLRRLANKTGLTNSEIVSGLLDAIEENEATDLLQSKIEEKRRIKEERRRLKQEVEAMDPQKVRALLVSLKKPDKTK